MFDRVLDALMAALEVSSITDRRNKITHICRQAYFGHCQISMTELFSQKTQPYMLTRFLKDHSDISVTKYIFYTIDHNALSICLSGQSSETVTGRFSVKKLF